MNCAEAAASLGPLADGELDPAAASALRAHVAACPHCSGELAALVRLRGDIRAEALRQAAPAALRERVGAMLDEAAARDEARDRASVASTRAPRRERWRWFASGALAGAVVAVLVGALTSTLLARQAGTDLAAEAVASHVRATLGQRLIEVASSDRHTVKPWLSARLDYAAPVPEPAGSGFALAGARVDSLDRRPVATLVYRYGNHVVDVFVRPLAAPAGPALESVRGFNVARAQGGGMEWQAVADVDATVLAAFVGRLARDAAAGQSATR